MKPNKTQHRFDVGKALLIGAAAFQSYQFGRALGIYDPNGWNIKGVNIGGLILGLIVNISIAWASTQLPSINGKNRIKSAWTAFYVLMFLSPALVAPAMYMIYIDKMFWVLAAALAFGFAIAPDLTITLSGFIAGKSLIPAQATQSETQKSQSETKNRKAKPQKSLADIPCRYGCGKVGSQNAMNAHAKGCPNKPRIQIDQSLLIPKESIK